LSLSPLKAMFSACRFNVIMSNGSVWVARFGAVFCGISVCSFYFITLLVVTIISYAVIMGGRREILVYMEARAATPPIGLPCSSFTPFC
jgi:hypothetical protein